MRTPPADLCDAAVAAAVAAHWSISSTSIHYAAVGFGSHHWLLTGQSGRWFVLRTLSQTLPPGRLSWTLRWPPRTLCATAADSSSSSPRT